MNLLGYITDNYASPIFTAASFAVISFAFFFITGCSADSSIAGATDEQVATAEAVFEGILKDETSKLTVRCVHD